MSNKVKDINKILEQLTGLIVSNDKAHTQDIAKANNKMSDISTSIHLLKNRCENIKKDMRYIKEYIVQTKTSVHAPSNKTASDKLNSALEHINYISTVLKSLDLN